MRLFAAALALLAFGCQDTSGSNLPVNPGGGGGGGGSGGFNDAAIAIDTPDAGPTYRVCLLLNDLRGLSACSNSGASGIKVTLGSGTDQAMATIATMDGSFTIVPPTESNMQWNVTGDSIFPTVMDYADGNIIPVISIDDYGAFALSNGVSVNTGDGAVFVHVMDSTNMNKSLMGATATIAPPNAEGVFYDNPSNQDTWDTGATAATGTMGTIWIPNVDPGAGAASISLVPSAGVTAVPLTVPIIPETLTMKLVSVAP